MPSFTDISRYTLAPLLTPRALHDAYPLTSSASQFVIAARRQAANIMQGDDPRLLVIMGPCSIHNPEAAYEYASHCQRIAERFANELFIVMRVYLEKPRSVLGWPGFVSDPHLDNSYDINYGLRAARELLIKIIQLGVPTATEFLDTSMPRYYSDLICWNAVGARTVTSQVHRQMVSSLAMPTGFKNALDGNIKLAIDAMQAAQHPHHFVGLSDFGEPAIIASQGNPHCHLVLRGSLTATNYSLQDIQAGLRLLVQHDLLPYLMVDCSHGNSLTSSSTKQYLQQKMVVSALTEMLKQQSTGLKGVMLESHLLSGKQSFQPGQPLVYGRSITDACLSWEETELELEKLARCKVSQPVLIPS